MTNFARRLAALSLTVVASALLVAGAVAPAAVQTSPVAQTASVVA